MHKGDIINEIKRTAEENGGVPLGYKKFESETGINRYDWLSKYWTKWSDALKEAGYEPNVFGWSYGNEILINKLIDFIREIG